MIPFKAAGGEKSPLSKQEMLLSLGELSSLNKTFFYC